MLEQRKKLALAVFGVIYLVFGLMLVYMLFFNVGLALDEKYDAEKGDKILVFKNASSRVIKDITISYIDETGKKTELQKIVAAAPGSETEINLSQFMGKSELDIFVEAPFHISVDRKIALKASSTGLAYNLQFPGLVIAKTPLMFELQMCNNLDFNREITVEESHETEFFAEAPATKPVSLEPNGCTTLDYTLVPLKEGSTVIYFNVKVANNTEKIEKKVDITG
jgi:hypothetical protein